MGLYLDAAPGVAARAVVIRTPTPGFLAGIYAAQSFDASLPFGDPRPLSARGWSELAPPRPINHQTVVGIDTGGTSYRYYLVWITRLQAEQQSGGVAAQISDVTLHR